MKNQPNLLDGVRVIDLSRVLAGPYCTMLLGDLGAEIIKIELPEKGDDTRHWGPPFTPEGESAYFLCVNRSKRGMTLNLKSERGKTILKELIAQGDVLIENFRVGTLERWGFGYETLQQIRPGLIYCSITGFGATGPYKDMPGYDFIVQALGGLMSITGPVEGPPFKVGVAIVDLFAGLFAANAILASLYARKQTGRGQRIDISLLDSLLATLANTASNYLISGLAPARYGNAHPNIVPYEVFQTSDQYIALGIGNDAQWAKFCQMIERPEWALDERFAANQARVEHRDLLIPKLQAIFLQEPARVWLDRLEAADIPVAPINTIDQVFHDPQVQARQMEIHMQHATGRAIPMVASPIKIPTSPIEPRYAPPILGQSTEEILIELLGYDAEKIQSLREANII